MRASGASRIIVHCGDYKCGHSVTIYPALQLGNRPRNGNHYEPEDVQRMMHELWEEFVAKNAEMFKT